MAGFGELLPTLGFCAAGGCVPVVGAVGVSGDYSVLGGGYFD